MSYDVDLRSPDGALVKVDPHIEGGTYAIGGINDASLNITYNYSAVYSIFEFSIRDLHEKRAGDMLQIMEAIVKKCGTYRFHDYWAPTPGNAGYALDILCTWARAHPDAIFTVS